MVKTHVLHLPGVDNFRSLAGMPTLCGRRIAGHSLLRSDQLHRLTAASWQVLQRLGLKAVCDLRSAGERECYPSGLPAAGLQHLHLAIGDDLRADPGIAAMQAENSAVEGAQRMMLEVYQRLPGLLAGYMPALLSLFTTPKPSVLIHCAAGKDRTGVAVALLLHALGVEPGQIMADYLRSARRFCQLDTLRQQAMHTAVSRMMGQPVSEAAINVMLDARPEYLNAAYAVIEAEYGGLEQYLARFSGMDRCSLDALRNRLLVV
ncbi:tyrosine-protein phosphatase [Pseudomonas capeferrum]|uniref:tyrosine-protein phosphatase n=1 Tax=Pseudomonas capeferrum TaxID=1495066 RepID=UPI0015E28E2A|nr:tyrosine-protein phosphatase [Pseudomonas capeferrum]MBA1204326.1 tyrosine-protein phosphatase [Pseudomonas capeferrum]